MGLAASELTRCVQGITAADLSFGDSLFEFSFLADANPNDAWDAQSGEVLPLR